jgi:hypothetical protein
MKKIQGNKKGGYMLQLGIKIKKSLKKGTFIYNKFGGLL